MFWRDPSFIPTWDKEILGAESEVCQVALSWQSWSEPGVGGIVIITKGCSATASSEFTPTVMTCCFQAEQVVLWLSDWAEQPWNSAEWKNCVGNLVTALWYSFGEKTHFWNGFQLGPFQLELITFNYLPGARGIHHTLKNSTNMQIVSSFVISTVCSWHSCYEARLQICWLADTLISHENSFPKWIWIWNEHGVFSTSGKGSLNSWLHIIIYTHI